MAVIQFQQLSMAEAEQCVAEIWTCLEEYQIPSPTMSFEFHGPRWTSITVNIEDPIAADTMLTRLSRWIETENGAAPLSFVLAAAAHVAPSYPASRSRRK